jgi:hypothetical protein
MSGHQTMWTKPPTLGMFNLPVIKLDCSECGRQGQYNRDRAIERHGRDMTLNQFMRMKANCPRDRNERRPCRVGCPDLVYMFTGAPFQDREYK